MINKSVTLGVEYHTLKDSPQATSSRNAFLVRVLVTGSSFRTTISPVSMFIALFTQPKVPDPTVSKTRKCWIILCLSRCSFHILFGGRGKSIDIFLRKAFLHLKKLSLSYSSTVYSKSYSKGPSLIVVVVWYSSFSDWYSNSCQVPARLRYTGAFELTATNINMPEMRLNRKHMCTFATFLLLGSRGLARRKSTLRSCKFDVPLPAIHPKFKNFGESSLRSEKTRWWKPCSFSTEDVAVS